jgi:small subunit ribosomal protein S17
MDEQNAAAATERGRSKQRTGLVVSSKMDKTITVAVEGVKYHPIYGKAMKNTKKFKAHDERNECNVGDLVRIVETRPLSKTKRWRLIEIVKRAD